MEKIDSLAYFISEIANIENIMENDGADDLSPLCKLKSEMNSALTNIKAVDISDSVNPDDYYFPVVYNALATINTVPEGAPLSQMLAALKEARTEMFVIMQDIFGSENSG